VNSVGFIKEGNEFRTGGKVGGSRQTVRKQGDRVWYLIEQRENCLILHRKVQETSSSFHRISNFKRACSTGRDFMGGVHWDLYEA